MARSRRPTRRINTDLDLELVNRLEELGELDDRKLTYMLNRAIESYLESRSEPQEARSTPSLPSSTSTPRPVENAPETATGPRNVDSRATLLAGLEGRDPQTYTDAELDAAIDAALKRLNGKEAYVGLTALQAGRRAEELDAEMRRLESVRNQRELDVIFRKKS